MKIITSNNKKYLVINKAEWMLIGKTFGKNFESKKINHKYAVGRYIPKIDEFIKRLKLFGWEVNNSKGPGGHSMHIRFNTLKDNNGNILKDKKGNPIKCGTDLNGKPVDYVFSFAYKKGISNDQWMGAALNIMSDMRRRYGLNAFTDIIFSREMKIPENFDPATLKQKTETKDLYAYIKLYFNAIVRRLMENHDVEIKDEKNNKWIKLVDVDATGVAMDINGNIVVLPLDKPITIREKMA